MRTSARLACGALGDLARQIVASAGSAASVTVRAGEGSPWHVHPDEDEWFYVLEGESTVYVGDRRLSLPAGAFAFGPKASRTPSSARRTGRGP